MKKFLLKVALFFVLVAVLDVICGWGFDFLRSKARGGQTHKNEYIANECMDDILILGSSKADHHYVPSVFEDSLGLTCYNAGVMGCGIIPAYIRYKMVCERQKPKLVLYEVTPVYDYLQDNGYSSYLGVMRQYTSNKIVRDVYMDFSDKLEGLRLLSNMYRNNSKLITNMKDVLATPDKWKGYEPLYGILKPQKTNGNSTITKPDKKIDKLKYSYVEKLIMETKKDGVPFVFILSPGYNGVNTNSDYQLAFTLAQKYDITVIDNMSCELFVGESEYYQDYTHLNHEGAVAYSQYVVGEIRKIISANVLIGL